MIDVQQMPQIWSAWTARYSDRDDRHRVIDAAVRGDFNVLDPDEEEVLNRSPNLIQVALEDTAEASSLLPTIRCLAMRTGERAKQVASDMEQIGWTYLEENQLDLKIPRWVMDAGAYGLMVATVTPDKKERRVLIERRDPRTCYPEPGFRPGDTVRRCMFARSVYWSQLPAEWQNKIRDDSDFMAGPGAEWLESDENIRVVLADYYDEEEIVLVALLQGEQATLATGASGDDGQAGVSTIPVELSRTRHGLGACPVIIESRISLDGEFRGQFDQVVDMLLAHIRLMGLVLDYADQAVYSDVWVRDLIGELAWGGGAYIELGPNGAIGRVPPAVSSLDVTKDLEALVDSIHVAGRWPKSRPGEIDQSIASAKFLETSVGMMNTTIRTYHQLLQKFLEKTLRVAFLTDKKLVPGKKVAAGILRNQSYRLEYDTAVIDPSVQVRVEYGLGLGRDPSQSAVLHIQYSQNQYISKEYVQENIEGLKDVAREQARIDLEQLKGMAFAKLLQGVEAGTIPDRALVEIARKREDGESIWKLYEEYVVKPAEEAAAAMVPTGMGAPMEPGPLGPEQGAAAGPEGIPAPPPSAPPGAELLARLNAPAGPGGTLGAQVTRG